MQKENNTSNEGLNEGLKLSDTEFKIYTLIQKRKQIISTQIIKETNLSHATVERAIKKLVEKSLIKRVGAKKNGHWEIIQ